MADEWTFTFIDLAGFSALTEVHGDEQAADLAGRFVSAVREELDDGSRLIKTLGDAVLLVAPTPDDALDTAARLLDRLGRESDFPIPRTGIHHGSAVERDGDYFGSAVNIAARVAAQAHGDQVLATESTAGVARAKGHHVVDLGEFTLKNIADALHLFDIRIGPRSDATAVDPICRMRVDLDAAAGRLRHDDIDYWFCSLQCVAAFLDRQHVRSA